MIVPNFLKVAETPANSFTEQLGNNHKLRRKDFLQRKEEKEWEAEGRCVGRGGWGEGGLPTF